MALANLFQAVRQYFSGPVLMRAVSSFPAESLPPVAPVPVPPAQQRMTAVDILRNEPHLTAAELAQRAGVTMSYANMLVRRKRARPVALQPARPGAVPVPAERVGTVTHAQIYDAAVSGRNVDEIAEQFCVAAGEVEFALKIARLSKKH
jgi:hypothetical protein